MVEAHKKTLHQNLQLTELESKKKIYLKRSGYWKQKIIQQQQWIRLSDVVKNANGVYVGSGLAVAHENRFGSRGY